jgi:hypothetical protein
MGRAQGRYTYVNVAVPSDDGTAADTAEEAVERVAETEPTQEPQREDVQADEGAKLPSLPTKPQRVSAPKR